MCFPWVGVKGKTSSIIIKGKRFGLFSELYRKLPHFHRSLGKQFQSKTTFLENFHCTLTLIRSKKNHYLLFDNKTALLCKHFSSPHPKILLCQDWLVLEKTIFRFHKWFFFAILLISLHENWQDPSFKQTWIPQHKDYLCQFKTKFGHCYRSRVSIKTLMSFCYFDIVSPFKLACPFIWINLNSLHPKMLYVSMEFQVFAERLCSLSRYWFLLCHLPWEYANLNVHNPK